MINEKMSFQVLATYDTENCFRGLTTFRPTLTPRATRCRATTCHIIFQT